MLIGKSFVLTLDVNLIPIEELAEDIRLQIDVAEGDYAVTCLGSRTRTKIISTEAAQLLKEFRTAHTIVEAVLRYSKARTLDAEQVLEASFPLLESLIAAGWLVDADGSAAGGLRASLTPRQRFGQWEVLRCVQLLEDTEIYQVRDETGRDAALKILRPDRSKFGRETLARETAILQHLDGKVNASLLETGTYQELPYMLLEWIQGPHATVAAEELRRKASDEGCIELLRLCQNVAAGYAHLHEQNVIHGDVHPRNLLVKELGTLVIIDFGLARLLSSVDQAGGPPRGGISFFFEPEYAEKRLAGQAAPMISPAGEQFALATLLYYLFTGSHYLAFSLEKEAQLRQILQGAPISFARRGCRPWPEVEACLARALRKNPAERYASVREFADKLALATIPRAEAVSSWKESSEELADVERVSQRVLAQIARTGPLLSGEPLPPPRSSVNYGAAGIAYGVYRLACQTNDAGLLALADIWANTAARDIAHPDAFFSSALDITPKSVGTTSPFHTASGVYCVQALISQAMGDMVSRQEAIERFALVSAIEGDNLDLTLGRSGTLLACTMILEAASDSALIRDLGSQVATSLLDRIAGFRPIAEANEIKYLGVAHGWAGILYAILRWCDVTDSPIPDAVPERLQQLAACAQSEDGERGLRWARLAPLLARSRGVDYMPGWCNGTAGFVHLWTLAHQMLRGERYLLLAEKAAWSVRMDPEPTSNLCCGRAGRAYALLNLYKHTGQQDLLTAAHRLAKQSALETPTAKFPAHSLYKGELGIALLMEDLRHPELSSMPFFESEG